MTVAQAKSSSVTMQRVRPYYTFDSYPNLFTNSNSGLSRLSPGASLGLSSLLITGTLCSFPLVEHCLTRSNADLISILIRCPLRSVLRSPTHGDYGHKRLAPMRVDSPLGVRVLLPRPHCLYSRHPASSHLPSHFIPIRPRRRDMYWT
jgi:hypothetical protein